MIVEGLLVEIVGEAAVVAVIDENAPYIGVFLVKLGVKIGIIHMIRTWFESTFS